MSSSFDCDQTQTAEEILAETPVKSNDLLAYFEFCRFISCISLAACLHENPAVCRFQDDILDHFIAVATSLLGRQNFTHFIHRTNLDVRLSEGSERVWCYEFR